MGNKISFEMENVGIDQWKELMVDVDLVECVPSVLVGLEERNKSMKIPATTGIRRENVQSNRVRFTVRDCLFTSYLYTLLSYIFIIFTRSLFRWPSRHD